MATVNEEDDHMIHLIGWSTGPVGHLSAKMSRTYSHQISARRVPVMMCHITDPPRGPTWSSHPKPLFLHSKSRYQSKYCKYWFLVLVILSLFVLWVPPVDATVTTPVIDQLSSLSHDSISLEETYPATDLESGANSLAKPAHTPDPSGSISSGGLATRFSEEENHLAFDLSGSTRPESDDLDEEAGENGQSRPSSAHHESFSVSSTEKSSSTLITSHRIEPTVEESDSSSDYNVNENLIHSSTPHSATSKSKTVVISDTNSENGSEHRLTTASSVDSSMSFDFTRSLYHVSIAENSLSKVYATSNEKMGIYISDPALTVRYKIVAGDVDKTFRADHRHVGNFYFLLIRVRHDKNAVLNRENRARYDLRVRATITSDSSKTIRFKAKCNVTVTVTDRNDISPFFFEKLYRADVPEDVPLETKFMQVTAMDPDSGLNGEIYYSLAEETKYFAIHPTLGFIYNTRSLSLHELLATQDSSLQPSKEFDVYLTVLARDRGFHHSLQTIESSKSKVHIRIMPVNRHPPQILIKQHSTLSRTTERRPIYAVVHVTDADLGVYGEVCSFTIVSGNEQGFFRLVNQSSSRDYNVELARPATDLFALGRELPFDLMVRATDCGGLSANQTIHLSLDGQLSLSFQFGSDKYYREMHENSLVGTQVIQIDLKYFYPHQQESNSRSARALDSDQLHQEMFNFNIISGNVNGTFGISRNGVVYTRAPLDRESVASYVLVIRAQHKLNQIATTMLYVDIIDDNDHYPAFRGVGESGIVQLDVPENKANGSVVYHAEAYDLDLDPSNRQITYELLHYRQREEELPFTIDTYSGDVMLIRPLDYELLPRQYLLFIRASDWGEPFRRQSEIALNITVVDVNDHRPQFEKLNCTVHLPPNTKPFTEIMTLSAIDLDHDSSIRYKMFSPEADRCFRLNENSGKLELICNLKKESKSASRWALSVSATDGHYFSDANYVHVMVGSETSGTHAKRHQVNVECADSGIRHKLKHQTRVSSRFQVFDISSEEQEALDAMRLRGHTNHPPVIDNTLSEINLAENTPVGSKIATLHANDTDLAFDGRLIWSLNLQESETSLIGDKIYFDIGQFTGELYLVSPLDYETQEEITLHVTVCDQCVHGALCANQSLRILVEDVNDNAPKVPDYHWRVSEATTVHTVLGTVHATDRDSNDNAALEYYLEGHTESIFSIDLFNGTVRLEKELDRETTERYTLYVIVTDSGTPALSSTSVINIIVTDINDNAPQFFQSSYFVKVREDMPVGTRLTRISAFDRDEGEASEIRYALVDSENETFGLDDLTGNLRLRKPLDYEKTQLYNLSLVAKDEGQPSLSTTTYLLVEVEDVNENYHAPRFPAIYANASVREGMPVGTLVTQVTAVDDDNPTLPLIYQIVGGNGLGRFTIDSTGNVYTAVILDCETESYFWLTVVAKDRAAVPLSTYLELYIQVEDVNDMPPITTEAFYTTSLYENATIGTKVLQLEAYDQDVRLSKSKPEILFRITNTVPFEIDATGTIRTSGQLDREELARYVIDVEVWEPPADSSNNTAEQIASLTSRTPVIVHVLDVNEFEPKSVERTYRCYAYSNAPRNLPVCQIVSFDRDEDDTCPMHFRVIEGNEKNYFSLDVNTGDIYTTLDFIPKGSYDFVVEISDCGRPEALTSSTHVIIRVQLPNEKEDNRAPVIEPLESTVLINRHEEVGYTVAWVRSSDEDGDQLVHYVVGGNEENTFAFLDSGSLVLAKSLLHQAYASQYNLTVMVSDGKDNVTLHLLVKVFNDLDEVAPFAQSQYVVNVLENITLGSEVLQMNVQENELAAGQTVFAIYSTQAPNTMTKFEIESWSGRIRVKNTLDFESGTQHVMLIEARSARKHSLSYHHRSFARVVINVIDVNDQTPHFIMPYFEANVLETSAISTSVLQLQAFDGDFGQNAKIYYSIVSGNLDNAFEVEPNLGYIYIAKQLSFRDQPEYYLLVKATDGGIPALYSTANVHILVSLPDNSPPKFEQNSYIVDIREDEKIGTVVLSLRMANKQTTFYEIINGNTDQAFAVNINNGEVYLRKRLDYERTNNYTLTVSAVSLLGVNVTAKIFVSVIDINDNAPYWKERMFEGQVFETMPINTIATTEDGQPLVVQAYDKDSAHNLVYAIVEEQARQWFTIEPRTGAVSLTAMLSCTRQQEFIFSVSVTDYGFPTLKADTNAEVRVKCLPVNDCPPVFTVSKFRDTLLLPTYSNVIITKVTASDCDFKPEPKQFFAINPNLKFSLLPLEDQDKIELKFNINATTGQITTATKAIEAGEYEMRVQAFDGKFVAEARVVIMAKPMMKSSLRFRHDRFYGSIVENSGSIKTVLVPSVEGAKLHEHFIYRIMNPTNHFKIARTSGAILYRGVPVDREQQSKFELAIEVQSIAQRHRIATALVEITVEDVNDNQPIFVGLPYHFVFNTDATVGSLLGRVQAVDIDNGLNGQVRYSVLSGDSDSLFALNAHTGHLTLARPVDPLDDLLNYTLVVMAKDLGEPPLESSINVTLRMVTGGVPVFSQAYYNVTVSEAHAPMVPFITLKAESPHGRQIFYNIESGNENDEFALDFNTGTVSVTEKLDRETISRYNLVISATDAISGASSTANLYITVEDANDNQPMFTRFSYNVSVAENLPLGSSVLRVEATDPDAGLNARLQYHIVGNRTHFYISPDDGVIHLKSNLDYESETYHHFSIMVTDFGSPQLTSTAQVWVEVVDVNDNPPSLPASYTTIIEESIASGEFVTMVTASDADWSDRAKLHYRILDGAEMAFRINETTGAVYVRSLRSSHYYYHHYRLKHQSAPMRRQYSLNVSVSDSVYSATQVYHIHIKPVNHHTPRFSRVLNNVAIGENTPVGKHVFTLNATDQDDSQYGYVDYHILNDYARKYFSLDPLLGSIKLKTELDYESGDRFYWLVLGAQDKGRRLGISALRVALTDQNDNQPRFIVNEYRSTVCSNSQIGATILSVLALDDDEDPENTVIKYSIYDYKPSKDTLTTTTLPTNLNDTEVNINDYFEIASDTGSIYIMKNLSSLEGKMIQFFVKAVNNVEIKNGDIENVVPVTIQVSAPCQYHKTEGHLYEVFVKENVEGGSVVANLALGNHKDVELTIVGLDDSNDASKFRLDKYGQIFVNEPLDREVKSKHTIAIQLTDRITFAVDYFYVIINIMDENDCTPFFDSSSYFVSIAEDQEAGSTIFKVNAIDHDIDLLNNALHYSLKDNFDNTFAIDENAGWITLNKQLDRERLDRYELLIEVFDGIHSNSTSLFIDVFDVNDNPPTIEKSTYVAAIFENSLLGTVILRVKTEDPDLNPTLRYYISDGDYLNQFEVSTSGDVYLNKMLDRETIDQYALKILVTDGKYQTETQVLIEILDVNDNGPICAKSNYVEMVSEAVPPNTYILTVEAVDEDDVENSKMFFTLSGDYHNHFAIEPEAGRLRTNAKLDRETIASYHFQVVVYDDKNRNWHCTSHVEILLSDVNDEAPKFVNQLNSINIPEDSPVGIILGKVTAIDLDLGSNRQTIYELTNSTGEFLINENNGIIRLAKSLDREAQSFYNLTIMAIDGGSSLLNSTTYFTINVTDINDNAPEFELQSYRAKVYENATIGTEIVKIFATSKDTGINAEIVYTIVTGNFNDTFAIHPKTGVVSVAQDLDYESVADYFLTVKAQDQGVPPLSSEVNLVILVQDVNDMRPRFAQRSYDIVIREDAQIGERIYQLVASDGDSPPNANLTYSFQAGSSTYKEFRVDSTLGILTVDKQLDREMISSYILEVFCTDNGSPEPLSASVLINVEISDYNDNAPVFDKVNQTVYLQEGRPVGYTLIEFNIQDADSSFNSGPFVLEIIEGNKDNAFSIVNSDTSLKTNKIFDSSTQGEYNLTIKVTDAGTPPLHSLNWISVVVIQEPQSPPKIVPLQIAINSLDYFPGGLIGQINATDEDQFDKLTYTLVNGEDNNIFTIDSNEGTLRALPGLDMGKYQLNVSVTDGKFVSHSTVELDVFLISEPMVEHAMVIMVRSITVADFIDNHLKNFIRITKTLFNVKSKDVVILSLQPIESGRSRRDSSQPGDISLLFVVASSEDHYYSRDLVRAKLFENKFLIENQLGLSFDELAQKSSCEESHCVNGQCREDLVLSENQITAIASSKVTFVSPYHEYRFGCACQPGFGGPSCNVTVNECYRQPCPAHKECVPVSSTLGYVCQCPFGKSGPSCNQNAETCQANDRDVSVCYQETNPLSFNGNSYVRYAYVKKIDKIALRFRTQKARARIFSQQNDKMFNILEIIGSNIQYRYDCGEGEGLIRIHNLAVNDGKWHEIIVEKRGNSATLTLDRKYRSGGFAPGPEHYCSRLKADIYFGGEVHHLGDEQIMFGFTGCLDNILFNGHQVPFHKASKSPLVVLKTLANVEFSCAFRADTGPCQSQPCLNGGTCTNLINGSYACTCLGPSYRGRHCEINTDPCQSSPCLNQGQCVADREACERGQPNCYQCECRAGFTGAHCQISRFCTSGMCQNGGVCEETNIGPKCHCHTGWHGMHCQQDIDECQLSTPACHSPATCINLPGTFRCICPINTTETCNGEGLLPSHIATSQFAFTIEEMVIGSIVLFAIIITAFVLVCLCACRARRSKKRPTPIAKHEGELLLKNGNATYENFTSNYAQPKGNQIEMSNLANTVFLGSQRANSIHELLQSGFCAMPNAAAVLNGEELTDEQIAQMAIEYASAFKRNAPVASVSPQLMELKKHSPKGFFKSNRHRSRQSLQEHNKDPSSSPSTSSNIPNHNNRATSSDFVDQTAYNDDQPPSLTNSNHAEGYHWDTSDLCLSQSGSGPVMSNLVEFGGTSSVHDAESLSEHSHATDGASESNRLLPAANRATRVKTRSNETRPGECAPLLESSAEGNPSEENGVPSPPLGVKLGSKLEFTCNYIERYLPRHNEEEWNKDIKRRNIFNYANGLHGENGDHGKQEVGGGRRKSSMPSEALSSGKSPSTFLTFTRCSLAESADNFSLLTPSSSTSTTPIAAMVASSSSNSDATTSDQCSSSMSSSSAQDLKSSPTGGVLYANMPPSLGMCNTDGKTHYGSHNGNLNGTSSPNSLSSFGYGNIQKRASPPSTTNGTTIVTNGKESRTAPSLTSFAKSNTNTIKAANSDKVQQSQQNGNKSPREEKPNLCSTQTTFV